LFPRLILESIEPRLALNKLKSVKSESQISTAQPAEESEPDSSDVDYSHEDISSSARAATAAKRISFKVASIEGEGRSDNPSLETRVLLEASP